MLLDWLLKRLIRIGTLKLVDADGRTRFYRGESGPSAGVRLHKKSLHWTLALNPYLKVGEAYTNGSLTIEGGSVYDFLVVAAINLPYLEAKPFFRVAEFLRLVLRRLHQLNMIGRARTNVAHHYDLSGKIYDLFLDSDRQYSCAYFVNPDDDLEMAQERKKYHLASKLLLKPGQRVLDIGSGWGGLGLYLARNFEVDVTGMTLSSEQHEMSRERAEKEDLAKHAHFYLRDYREQTGRFDRVVSVGMFEHVGVGYYRAFFGKIRELLADDGVALIHTIGRTAGPGTTNPWIRKYIFPGGYIPALSEMTAAIEKSGLVTTDVEVLRLHYAETLRHWRNRFVANWKKAAEIYDERFCRMWEFYLAASEVAFRHMDLVVYQIQLARDQNAVPLTRDYAYETEERLAERERHHRRSSAA